MPALFIDKMTFSADAEESWIATEDGTGVFYYFQGANLAQQLIQVKSFAECLESGDFGIDLYFTNATIDFSTMFNTVTSIELVGTEIISCATSAELIALIEKAGDLLVEALAALP